jgi:hypothetical protein
VVDELQALARRNDRSTGAEAKRAIVAHLRRATEGHADAA